MKNEKKIYFFNKKRSIKQKYYFLFFEFILILLKCIYVNLQPKYDHTFDFYITKIHLVIQIWDEGPENIYLMNQEFKTFPFKIVVNGREYSIYQSNLHLGRNEITLFFGVQIQSCENMFSNLINIVEVNLSDFDASKVTSMRGMFYDCVNLENIYFGNINTSSLIDMESLFQGSNITSIDLSKFETSKVTSMNSMFYNCSNLNEINFGNIDTSSLENIEFLFYGCSSLISIDISNFKISKVTSMYCLFCYCSNLENINFGNIKTYSVENMESLFEGCSKLSSINLLKFDTSNVVTMSNMFYNCYNLKYLDLLNFVTPKVSNIYSMFYNCSSLLYLNLYQFKMESPINKTDAFEQINPKVKYCIKDIETKNYLLGNDTISVCSDTCYNENNFKIDIINNTCVESCPNERYEYYNICYNRCPKGTLLNGNLCEDNLCLGNNKKILECDGETPEGYYYDKEDEIYKKCFENCRYCYGEGNETINNCKTCKENFRFFNK